MSLPFFADQEQPWPENFEFPDPNVPREEEHSQWIERVLGFSSQFGSAQNGSTDWCATLVAGPPRVLQYGDNPMAWAPQHIGNPRPDWLEVQLARPVKVQRVLIHESLCGGAFSKLELWCPVNEEYIAVVEQEARCGQYPRAIRIEDIRIPPEHNQGWETDKLKFEFMLEGGGTWYEVDAIRVVGMARQEMPKPKPQCEKVSQDIAKLLKDKSTADCTLVLDDANGTTRIPVHRGILAARCPLFRKKLDNNEMPLGGEQKMEGMSLPILEQILEWIYTGAVQELDVCDSVILATAADYFQINDLAEHCINIFRQVLTAENAAELYAHFDGICVFDSLILSVLEFMAKEFLAVSQTPGFAKLSQPQLLAVIRCYNQLQKKENE